MGLFGKQKEDKLSKDSYKTPMGLEDLPPVPPLAYSQEKEVKPPVVEKNELPTAPLYEPITEKEEFAGPVHEETTEYYEPVEEGLVESPFVEPQPTFEGRGVPNTLPDLQIPVPAELDSIPFFSDARMEELPELPVSKKKLAELPEIKIKKQNIFIRTDDYSQILSNIDSMVLLGKQGPEIVYMLKNLNQNSNIVHEKYLNTLEDIQKKLIYIDNLLFESMK
ncbi:MAG: hypothetical protein AABW92_01085 [Nanoarchaeota archaeon]